VSLSRRVPEIVALLAVVLGIVLRLADLPSLLLFGDEYHGLELSRQSYARILSSFDMNGSGTALPLLQRICLDLFGDGQWAYRLPTVIGAIAGILVMYPVAKSLVGRSAAAIATLGLCTNSIHVFYSHFSRSYSIATFGCLVLVGALRRITRERAASGRWYLLVALSAALTPYAHLSALGLVVSVCGGAALLAWTQKRSRPEMIRLGAGFAAAGLLCVGLYLPAREPLWTFYRMMVGVPNAFSFGVLDVATLLAGSPSSAFVWLLGVPAASVWMLRSRRESALLLVPAALLPIAMLVLQHPYGSQINYAHYLLTSVPFMLMLMSWALVRGARALWPSLRRPKAVAVAAGVVLAALAFWDGPLGRHHTDDGPFANTYVSLHSQPAFDAPFEGTPAFYAALAKDHRAVRIIEAPALVNSALLLYRNYYLQTRKAVSLGFFRGRFGVSGPYVALFDPAQLRASDADYLVFHRDVQAELERYWEFVDPGTKAPWVRAPSAAKLVRLQRILGAPGYESDDLLVWRLRPSPSGPR
jgi:hypothetical protein